MCFKKEAKKKKKLHKVTLNILNWQRLVFTFLCIANFAILISFASATALIVLKTQN